jgi:predicted permease
MAAGYVWRFFNPGGIDRQRLRQALSAAVLHFFLPALAFNLVSSARIDQSFLAVPLTAACVTLIGMAAGFAVYKLLPWFRDIDRPALGVMILAAGFGNVTYLGLPMITGMLGAPFGYVAILYDLLAVTPILLTLGAFVAARYGSGKSVAVGASLTRVLRLPPLWGVVAGGFVQVIGIPVPPVAQEATGLMGRAVIPIMTFTIGLALDFKDLRRLPVAVPALALKLALAPILAWWIGAKAGLSAEQVKAVTIEGAMPVMVLTLVVADEFGLDVPLTATCIAVSTAALFVTLPLVMALLFS